jgi:hypothetical protein
MSRSPTAVLLHRLERIATLLILAGTGVAALLELVRSLRPLVVEGSRVFLPSTGAILVILALRLVGWLPWSLGRFAPRDPARTATRVRLMTLALAWAGQDLVGRSGVPGATLGQAWAGLGILGFFVAVDLLAHACAARGTPPLRRGLWMGEVVLLLVVFLACGVEALFASLPAAAPPALRAAFLLLIVAAAAELGLSAAAPPPRLNGP